MITLRHSIPRRYHLGPSSTTVDRILKVAVNNAPTVPYLYANSLSRQIPIAIDAMQKSKV